jgi:hypothetical protein
MSPARSGLPTAQSASPNPVPGGGRAGEERRHCSQPAPAGFSAPYPASRSASAAGEAAQRDPRVPLVDAPAPTRHRTTPGMWTASDAPAGDSCEKWMATSPLVAVSEVHPEALFRVAPHGRFGRKKTTARNLGLDLGGATEEPAAHRRTSPRPVRSAGVSSGRQVNLSIPPTAPSRCQAPIHLSLCFLRWTSRGRVTGRALPEPAGTVCVCVCVCGGLAARDVMLPWHGRPAASLCGEGPAWWGWRRACA